MRAKNTAAIDHHRVFVPEESSRTVFDDYPVVDQRAHTINITMEYASLGDHRYHMHERPKIWLDQAFFTWVGRQSLLGLNWLQAKNILHGDVKPANILAFPGRHSPHIKIGDLSS